LFSEKKVSKKALSSLEVFLVVVHMFFENFKAGIIEVKFLGLEIYSCILYHTSL